VTCHCFRRPSLVKVKRSLLACLDFGLFCFLPHVFVLIFLSPVGNLERIVFLRAR
jgi:hypothetical protein